MAATWSTLNEHWPHATYQRLPEAQITASFILTQYMGHLSLGDCFVQARKIPDTPALRVLGCYAVLFTTSPFFACCGGASPPLFEATLWNLTEITVHLRNLSFTDALAAAFLSCLKYSFLTPALQKLQDPGYSVPICHFCIFVWQGVPILVGPLAPGGGRCSILFSSSAILQCCITLASQSTSAAVVCAGLEET